MNIDVLDEARVASASIRGYLVQMLHAALAWLELKDGEVLLVEGDEDFDVVLRGGERVSTQVATYAGRLTAGHDKVKHSLSAFLRDFVARRQRGEKPRFVFLGVVEQPQWPEERWLQTITKSFPKVAEEAQEEAVAWLKENSTWEEFFGAITCRFDVVDGVDSLRYRLTRAVRARATGALAPMAELLADRLVMDLLGGASNPETHLRCRTAGDLGRILGAAADDLDAWSKQPEARRLAQAYDEVRNLAPLLDHGRLRAWREAGGEALVSRLLLAGSEVVPFDEDLRRAELDLLEEFCSKPERRVRALLLLGPGGSGKTRLIVEWIRRLKARGWHAGFLVTPIPASGLDAVRKGETPRLVVVDYADTRRDDIRQLLAVAGHIDREEGPQLRIVFLARAKGDWWKAVPEGSAQEDLLFRVTEERTLVRGGAPTDSDVAERRRLFDASVAVFAGALGREISSSSARRPDFAAGIFARPLFVLAAALAYLDGKALSDADQLMDAVLEREQRAWRRSLTLHLGREPAGRLPIENIRTALAGLTLRGRVPLSELPVFVGRAVRAAGPETAEVLTSLYARGNEVSGLEPDMLGERLVERVLHEDEALLDRAFPAGIEQGELGMAGVVLARLAAHDPLALPWSRRFLMADLERRLETGIEAALAPGASTAFASLGACVAEIVASSKGLSDDVLKRVLGRLPEQTVSMGPVGQAAARALVERAQQVEPAERARRLASQAYWLSEMGRREEALAPAREAVEIYRKLAEVSPDAFLPDLASALNNLGIRLSEVGWREEALAPAREAVEIYRKLAEVSPDAFLPALAISLNNLGSSLSEVGRREEALAPAREAVEIRRKLAEVSPDAFLPALASSLNNLGIRLSEVGRREEALASAREAVEIYRKLAEVSPDAFLPTLAISLNNLGTRLSEVGRREEALAPAREAVEIRRKLAEVSPDAFLPALASSLNNLGIRLSEVGRREEALAPARGAVEIYRKLAEVSPDAFLPALASALNNLGSTLGEVGRREEALAPAREGVEIYRKLAEVSPDAFRPALAMSLNNMGIGLSEVGRREEALAPAREAVEIYRKLAEVSPDAFLPDLAISLNNLGIRLSEVGRREEALAPAREAVEIYRKLAEDAFLPALAMSLNNLGNALSGVGRREEALAPAREAVEIYRKLAEVSPDAFLPALAISLNNLGNTLSEVGRREEALAPAREAVEIYRKLAEVSPDAFLPDLAISLNSLGNTLSEVGRREEALHATAEAEAIRAGLR